ncbi:rhodanese-like domain-containing protein [Streptomyces camelliae]|uniref:rhodanese-like domain-containing protein n=1 Tax=Streptomyces camelliae TaxID=3004093 RepID=UPI003D180A7E
MGPRRPASRPLQPGGLLPRGALPEWPDGSALPTLRQDRTPVFYCRTGVRTLQVLTVARAAGFTGAVHLEGGAVGWANEIDPRLPVY